jgi:hypothetical protein
MPLQLDRHWSADWDEESARRSNLRTSDFTDSNNDGNVLASSDNLVDDTSGKRIFRNTDDDNLNGRADLNDTKYN